MQSHGVADDIGGPAPDWVTVLIAQVDPITVREKSIVFRSGVTKFAGHWVHLRARHRFVDGFARYTRKDWGEFHSTARDDARVNENVAMVPSDGRERRLAAHGKRAARAQGELKAAD